MDNNKVLKKMAIAMNLRHEDVREIFHIGGTELSVSQSGALLVNPNNKNFQALSEEGLESFMDGLITYSRGPKGSPNIVPLAVANLVYFLGEKGREDALVALSKLVEDVLSQIREQLAEESEESEELEH